MKSLVISLTYFCVLVYTCVHVHVYRDACVYMCVEARGHPWVSILKWQISGAVHFVKTISLVSASLVLGLPHSACLHCLYRSNTGT